MRRRDDAGSATVLSVGVIAVVLTVTVAALAVLSAVRAAHVARSAADLAALAGAIDYQARSDPAAACAEAGRVAGLHDTSLRSCRALSLIHI